MMDLGDKKDQDRNIKLLEDLLKITTKEEYTLRDGTTMRIAIRGDDGIMGVVEKVCTACDQQGLGVLHESPNGPDIFFCTFCGRAITYVIFRD